MKQLNLCLKCNHLVNPLAVKDGEVVFSFCKNGYLFDEYSLGIASSENWSGENPTKRYEASAGIHKSGDVPLHIIPENVLNGTEGLVLDFNFEAWAQVENTSMCIELTAADII